MNGEFLNIDEKKYRSIKDIVSQSSLKHILRSPAHYKYYKDAEPESTEAQVFGRALHASVSEPENFLTEKFAIFSGKTRRGKEWDEFQIANEGKTIIKKDDLDKLFFMRDAILQNRRAHEILLLSHKEKSAAWIDEDTALPCKARFDAISNDYVTDIKTTTNAHINSYSRECANYEYPFQAAFYLDGAKLCDGKSRKFLHIAIEKEPPYCCVLFEMNEDAVKTGRLKYKACLMRLKKCIDLDEWPGYSDERILELSMPGWYA